MKTSKLAKCGIHGLSFCNHKHDAPQCDNCTLVKRRDHMYKFVNGHKLKRCPKCGEYKMLHEFKKNSEGYRSWCYTCHKEAARERHHTIKQPFILSTNNNVQSIDNAVTLIKEIRKLLIDDRCTTITIQKVI